MEACNLKQGSEEWLLFRLGKVSASKVADVMAKTKTGVSVSRKRYADQLLAERLTGTPTEFFPTAAMRRGTELEPKARETYELLDFTVVTEVGAIPHPTIPNALASPDGLVGDDGLIEIKCPNSDTHIDFLENGKPKKEYLYQMQWQMACTGRKWCDFVSYDDRMIFDELKIKVVRIERDDALIAELEEAVAVFLAEIDQREMELTKGI